MNQNQNLEGKTIAILATDGFEQSELEKPRAALKKAGAKTVVVSPKNGAVKGWETDHFGANVDVDQAIGSADADDYDGLLLPGGVMNPDKLRTIPEAVSFVRAFFDAGKPVAAICHGPQMLIEAGVTKGRKLTSFKSLKTDLINAGAEWIDAPVVVDRDLVTSRQPADIPQFNEKMIAVFAAAKAHAPAM